MARVRKPLSILCEFREAGRDRVKQNVAGHEIEFRFYSRSKKPVEGFKRSVP